MNWSKVQSYSTPSYEIVNAPLYECNIFYNSCFVKLISLQPFGKVGCVFPKVFVSILPQAEFVSNDHQEDAPLFVSYSFRPIWIARLQVEFYCWNVALILGFKWPSFFCFKFTQKISLFIYLVCEIKKNFGHFDFANDD